MFITRKYQRNITRFRYMGCININKPDFVAAQDRSVYIRREQLQND